MTSVTARYFRINTRGAAFTTLHVFQGGAGGYAIDGSSDGSQPQAVMLLSGNTLYGTTYYGGTNGDGAPKAPARVAAAHDIREVSWRIPPKKDN